MVVVYEIVAIGNVVMVVVGLGGFLPWSSACFDSMGGQDDWIMLLTVNG